MPVIIIFQWRFKKQKGRKEQNAWEEYTDAWEESRDERFAYSHTSPLFRVFHVIFRQYIPQRAGEGGGGLPNHCLFPLVVLDSFSTFFLSPHLTPVHPSLFLPFSLSGSYYLRLSSSHRIIPPSHTPGIDSVIPPRRERPRLALPGVRVCGNVYVHIGARRRACVRI